MTLENKAFNWKILVVWSWGREHALAWKLAQSDLAKKVYVAPWNGWTYLEDNLENVDIKSDDINGLLNFAKQNDISLTVVWPENPLSLGIVDIFEKEWLNIFGPSKSAARLESSKTFTKDFCYKYNIPTAEYASFDDAWKAISYIKSKYTKKEDYPVVIKADGLAAGKWVIIAQDEKQAIDTINDMLEWNKFWDAGSRVVIEEFLEWEELSMICMVDKNGNILPMVESQDHKPLNNGNTWPNTWWMGAYTPVPHLLNSELKEEIIKTIVKPTVEGMQKDGNTFSWFLYAWLMITKNWPKLLEYNVRFWDPETQSIMMKLESDFVKMCLAWINWELDKIEVKWSDKKAINIVLAAKWYPYTYKKWEPIIFPEWLENDKNVKIFHAWTKIENNKLLTNGWRVLNVTVLWNTIKSAREKALSIIEQIEWFDFHYRTDIWENAVKTEN